MFKIDSNQTIKLTKGDDVKFPVFLDQGTPLTPLRYPIYENMGCELYFSIFYKKDFDNPVLKKTFKDNGEIVTEKSNGDVYAKNGCTVNENNDFVITLEPEEDENGELIYTYIINTVTNRLPIYIIEDDYNRRIW